MSVPSSARRAVVTNSWYTQTAATCTGNCAMPSAAFTSSVSGARALAHSRRTRSCVSSPESVVRSMQAMAFRSQAICQSFLTVRRVTSVAARRSTALVLTRTASTQSRFKGMPGLPTAIYSVRASTMSARPLRKQANIAVRSFGVPAGAVRNSFQMNTPHNAATMVAPCPRP